ncbi:ENR1 protein, partial [Chloropsis hardwickii]|nr:ENR1 protein [Chloropsis hardwickii]
EETETWSGKNLFVDLIERISRELNLKNCWVCGSTQMSEYWPWDGISLKPFVLLKQLQQGVEPIRPRRREVWELENEITGEECILRVGDKYKTNVGKIPCKRYLIVKDKNSQWIPQTPNEYWSVQKKEKGCIY